MPTGASNDDLLRRAIAGEPLALDRLLIREQRRLLARVCSRLPKALSPSVGPEDILQDSFSQAFRAIGNFQPDSPEAFQRWITAITDNSLRDAIRRSRAVKRGGGRAPATGAPADPGRSSVAPLVNLLSAGSKTPSKSASRREAAGQVRAALARLRDDDREALSLRYLQGLSAAEVGKRMGRTETAVHKLCARALQRLRHELQPDGGSTPGDST